MFITSRNILSVYNFKYYFIIIWTLILWNKIIIIKREEKESKGENTLQKLFQLIGLSILIYLFEKIAFLKKLYILMKHISWNDSRSPNN